MVSDPITCFGNTDGEVEVVIIDVLAPYTVLWSTGATTNTISNCGTGAFTATVTDANGYVASESMILGQPLQIINSASSNDPTTFCQGGSALLETMYEASCTYQWLKYGNPIAGANSNTYLAKETGNYKVEIGNSSGCIAQSPIVKITKNGRLLKNQVKKITFTMFRQITS